jgi:hypothetical protein
MAEDPAFGSVRFLLSIQVDDFNVTVIGDKAAVARDLLSSAALELGEILEERLEFAVGRDKTVAVASTAVLARRVVDDLEGWGARAATAPRRLGLRFALGAGGGRSNVLQRARLGKLTRKSGR